MQKKIISKIVKPTINQIAKYIPGESLIDGKRDVINYHLMNLLLKFLLKFQ